MEYMRYSEVQYAKITLWCVPVPAGYQVGTGANESMKKDIGAFSLAALKQNVNTIYKYQDIVRFLYRESASPDRSTLHTVLSRETQYIELFENLLRNCVDAQHIDEDRRSLPPTSWLIQPSYSL